MMNTKDGLDVQAGPVRAGQDAWMLENLGMHMSGHDDAGNASGRTGVPAEAEPGGMSAGGDMPMMAMANTMPRMPTANLRKVRMTAATPGIVLGKNKAAVKFQKAVEDGAIKVLWRGQVVETGVVEKELKLHFTLTLKMVRNQVRDLEQIMDGIERSAGEFGTQMAARAELVDLDKFQREYRGLLATANVHVNNAQRAADQNEPVTFEAELVQASHTLNGVDRGIADFNGAITQGAADLAKLAKAVETGCNAALTILSVCAPVGILGKVIEGSIREIEHQVSDRVDGKPFDIGKLTKAVALSFLWASCGELINASAEEAIASRVRPVLLKRLGDPERVKQAILVLRVTAVATMKTCLETAVDALLPHEKQKGEKGKGTPKFEFAKAVLYEAMKDFVSLLLSAAPAA